VGDALKPGTVPIPKVLGFAMLNPTYLKSRSIDVLRDHGIEGLTHRDTAVTRDQAEVL
jgi:hypothetical protein